MGGFRPIFVPANASLLGGTPKARKGAEIFNREKNDNFVFTGDANLIREPKFFIAIFNVSDMEQRVERPWLNPSKRGKIMLIPACEKHERHGKPFLIPDIVQLPTGSSGSWEISARGVDGKFLAQDALNPEEPVGNWTTVRDRLEAESANEGTNLYHLGCFWEKVALEPPYEPSEEAVDTAIVRLERTYNRWIEEANLLALAGGMKVMEIGHTHRRAANYFGRSFTWNMRYEKQNQCPNCANPVPQTASRCFQCKYVFDWTRALTTGVATVEEAEKAGIMLQQAEHAAKPAKGGKKKPTE
jgi:hypothetical protein